MKRIMIAMVVATVCFGAQDIQFPASFDKLAAKAENVVNVTLDADALRFANQFLSEKKTEEKTAKDIVKQLKGIYIRSFEFAKPGQYTQADVDEIRAQLRPPDWTRIVSVTSTKKGGENAEIFLKKEDGKITGLTVLATEPKQLTVVHIVGTISSQDLGKLSGKFGIPNVHMGPSKEKEN